MRHNPQACQFAGYGAVFVRWGKSANGSPPRRRTVLTVPEMDWVVLVMQQWIEEVRPLFSPADHPALWVTERRGRLSRRAINEAFEEARAAAGLDPALDLHCLRPYITHLIEFGYPERFAQDQVGHAYASTTAIYTNSRVLHQAAAVGAGPPSAWPMAVPAASLARRARRAPARPAASNALSPRSPRRGRSAHRATSSRSGRAGAAGVSARSLSGRRRPALTYATAATRARPLSARSAGRPGPASGSVLAVPSVTSAVSGRPGNVPGADATALCRRNGRPAPSAPAAMSTFAGIPHRAPAARRCGPSSARMIEAGQCAVPASARPAWTTPAGNAAVAGRSTATGGASAACSASASESCSLTPTARSPCSCSPCWRRSQWSATPPPW
jgi:hypothetical protein